MSVWRSRYVCEPDLYRGAVCSSREHFSKKDGMGGKKNNNKPHRKFKTKRVGKLRHVSLASESEGSVSAWLVYQKEVKR